MAITDTMKTLTNMHVSNTSLYLFIFKNLINYMSPKIVGENHIKFQFSDIQQENSIGGIWFNSASFYEMKNNESPMEVVGSIDENIFRGKRTMQILIKDIRTV